MDGFLEWLVEYRIAVIFALMMALATVTLICVFVWRMLRRRPGETLETPPAFHVAPPIDPKERVHSQLVEFVKLASNTLLQDQLTSPEMIVEKLLDLARADVRFRALYVGYAFRFARQHNLGAGYFTRCSREVLEEAIIANLGFLHEWGHDGNVIVEHGLRREQAQMMRAAEPA